MTFFTRLTGFFRSGTKRAADPSRDWLMLLLVSFLLLVASVVWNVWFFGHVVEEGVTGVDGGSGTFDAYDSGAVDAIFEARTNASAAYKDTYLFVDPSR